MLLGIVIKISRALAYIGAINWGFVGLSYYTGDNHNVINKIFGESPYIESSMYIVIFFSAIICIFDLLSKPKQ